jgi:hypothetical protein
MNKGKWQDPIKNRNFCSGVIKNFMSESEFKDFCQKYGETRAVRSAWEASKEDWDFNRKFPKATIELWAERWEVGNDTAWKRLGKMYLLGRSNPTR